jgi:serine/threonine protein kinase/tetratricopeptide (TPR) repeat protein
MQSIFGRALEIESPADRAAYLDEACGPDAGLRAEIEGLLATLGRAGEFMRRPAAAVAVGGTAAYEPLTEGPGARVGPYKLLQQIGEGGMGVVYMAEQEEPVRRKVALKIIKPGMDSKQVVARFEAERQALAMMDHTNIAKVHDAGTTESGRPYFVMELVHGVPITTYCDENKLTPRERLELFVPICQAIQHAHQKGIIHRDIKPSNILVTMYDDKPVPKVIDFGVAKAVEQRLTEKTLFTQYGALVGTFEYMSPEQAEMNAFGVDTRSDIYSLGVLLYELLTGTTPLERARLKEAAFGEIVRLIKEEEPPRPSVRLSTSGALGKVAAARQTEPARLSRLVRGELDWIVMKALDKDRSRRYETANGFARDVQRYLHDEPVEACPPSAGYRMRKLARKHRTALAVGACFVISLLLLVVGSLWSALQLRAAYTQAEEQRQEAEDQRDRAERASAEARKSAAAAQRVSKYVLEDLLVSLAPYGSPRRTVSAEQVLNRASREVGKVFADDPEMEASARATIGWAYTNLMFLDAAERELGASLAIRQRVLGEEHPDTLWALTSLAGTLCWKGQFAEAEKLARRALEGQRRQGGDEVQMMWSMNRLAWAVSYLGKPAESLALMEEALAIARRKLGENDAQTLHFRYGRAGILSALGRPDEAVKEFREVLADMRRLLGEEHPHTLHTMKELSSALLHQGEKAEAEAMNRKVVEISRRVMGADHPWTIMVMKQLAWLLRSTGRAPDADALDSDVLSAEIRNLGEAREKVIDLKYQFALNLVGAGKHADAEPLLREVVAARRKQLPADDPKLMESLTYLNGALFFQKKHAECVTVLREVVAAYRKKLPAGHPKLTESLSYLGTNLFLLKKHAEAEPFLREAITAMEKEKQVDVRLLLHKGGVGACLLAQKKHAEAEPFLLAAVEGMKADQAKRPDEYKPGSFLHQRLTEALGWLVEVYDAVGKPNEAAKWRKELEAVRRLAKGGKP